MEPAPARLEALECVSDRLQARALLDPLRARILTIAREPCSASEIASRLKLPRQRVNYHVRELARRGLLRRAGRRPKGNMVEQRYVATARTFLLSPELLGPLEADWRGVEDTASAAYLLALMARVQTDLARAWRAAKQGGEGLSTLSLKSQFRFETSEQRARFAAALRQAVIDVIAWHTSPNESPAGRAAAGRAYRLVLGCYPYAPAEEAEPRSAGEER